MHACISLHAFNPILLYQVGETPLHLAAKNGYTDMVCFLMSKNAGIDKTNKAGC